MKKIYFAGKFNIVKDNNLPLEQRLENDFRSIILGSSKKLTYADNNLFLNKHYQYIGPFYCEKASNGDYTSTDCDVVINTEYEYVKNCDIYLALLDESFSVGTIVELDWALDMNKEIIIYYKEESSNYQIKSDYWFAIANALKKSNKITIKSFTKLEEVIDSIKKEILKNEI